MAPVEHGVEMGRSAAVSGRRLSLAAAAWVVAAGCAGQIGGTDGDGSPGTPGSGAASGNGGSGAGTTSAQCAASGATPYEGESLALTDRQLQRTLTELFPFELEVPTLPARPRAKHAFSTASVTNQLTFNQVTTMTEAAESIAAQAHDHLDEVMPCSVQAEGESCVSTWLDDFGARAFRRPLEATEKEALLTLYRDAESDGVSRPIATSLVIAAILQAPQFLYQLDVGTPDDAAEEFDLSSHEVAAHLAYLLTDAPPDATLRDLAAQNALTDAATIREQAERLLDSPRGHEMLKRFILEWFDVEGVDYSSRFEPALANAMAEELDRDLESWLFDDPSFPVAGLLSTATTQANEPLAAHYGLSGVSSGPNDWQQVELPDAYHGGLLTKGLVAARYSSLEEPSIILRGVFVLRELLCVKLGTPPNDAVDRNPQLPPSALPREKAEARAELDPCGTCHSVIDPVGLGMEELDQLGRFRTEYEGGAPVDNLGGLTSIGVSEFRGTAELAQILGASDEFLGCAAQQWSEYTFGKQPKGTCSAETVATAVREGDGSVRELILSLVTSRTFLARRRGLQGGN